MTTAPGGHGCRRELLAALTAGREERDLYALEAVGGQFLDFELFAAEGHGLARPSALTPARAGSPPESHVPPAA